VLLFSFSVICLLTLIPSKNKRAVTRRASQNKSSGSMTGVVSIPKLISSLQLTHRFRYIATAALSSVTPITRGYMLNTLLFNMNGSTSNNRICHAVRLVSITAYIPGGLPVWNGSILLQVLPQVTVTWASENAPQVSVTESNGGSVMTRCVFSPPKDTLASYWSASAQAESVPILYIQTSGGVTFDVVTQFQIGGNLQGAIGVTTVNAGTAGLTYMSYFDGPNSGNEKLIPVGALSLT